MLFVDFQIQFPPKLPALFFRHGINDLLIYCTIYCFLVVKLHSAHKRAVLLIALESSWQSEEPKNAHCKPELSFRLK